jgi:hypothetical protein
MNLDRKKLNKTLKEKGYNTEAEVEEIKKEIREKYANQPLPQPVNSQEISTGFPQITSTSPGIHNQEIPQNVAKVSPNPQSQEINSYPKMTPDDQLAEKPESIQCKSITIEEQENNLDMKKIKFGKWFSNKQNRKNFNEEIGRQFGVKVITNKKDFIWKIFAFIGILALISFVVSLTSSLVTGQDLWQGILDININHIFSFSNETWQKVGELINGSLR